MQSSKIRFTKHVREKFEFMKRYGFEIYKGRVIDAIQNPARVDRKDTQYFAIRAMDTKYALRAVYERRKDYLIVITFYPVRRERYGV